MITPQEPQDSLRESLGLPAETSLFFKREDLHPYGSHKGRSIPIMIDTKIKEGCVHFAISSSGNAALAAGMYAKELNKKNKEKITLEILAGKNINPKKLEKLEALTDENILLSLNDRPLQALFMKTLDPAVQSLRQSDNDTALIGYKELAEELSKIKNLKAIFIGTSSGTTAQSLTEYFENKNVEIHIIQTASCYPIAHEFRSDYAKTDEKSIADAIVDQTALRKDTLISLLEKTGGSGWIVSNEEIKAAQNIVKRNSNLEISTNSALSVAGLMQAIYTGKEWGGAVVCIICGD